MAKRRSPGLGTVESLPSGKYRVRMVGPNGKRLSSPTFATKEEAEMTRKSLLAVLCEEKIAPSKGMTLGQFGEKWLNRRRNRSTNTERGNFYNHILPSELASIPLHEIQRKDVKEFLYALGKKQPLVKSKGGKLIKKKGILAEETQARIFTLLRKCLADAKEDGFVRENMASGLRVQKQAVAGKKTNFLPEDEIEKLLSCQKIPLEFRLLYQFAIYTGLRRGELWPLQWEDIDLEGQYPKAVICRSQDGSTKSDTPRMLPLLPKAYEALQEWKRICPASIFVFPNQDGSRRSDTYDARWPEYRMLAGIRKVRFHDLRHTCTSHLLMGTFGDAWSVYETKEFLGHKSINTTQRYAHFSPDHLHKKAQSTYNKVHTKSMTRINSSHLHERKNVNFHGVKEEAGDESRTRDFHLGKVNPLSIFSNTYTKSWTSYGLQGQNPLLWLSISLLQFSANETPPPTSLIELLTVQAEPFFPAEHPAHLEIGRIRSGSFVLSSAIRLAEHVLALFQAQGGQEENHG